MGRPQKPPWPAHGFERTAVQTHLDVLLENHEAFEAQKEEIEGLFGRQEYVVFKDGAMVDHGPEKDALRGRNPGKGVYIGSVEDDGLAPKRYEGERPRRLM